MRTLILFLFISSFTFLQAQKIEVREVKVSDPKNILDQEEDTAVGDIEFEDMPIPFAVVEQIPLFGSCEKIEKTLQRECFQEEMKKHIENHLNYPEEAKNKKVENHVVTIFDIDKEGKVINLVVRGKQTEFKSLFEEEVKRIIEALPQFSPGLQRDKPVIVKYSIPITFKL